MNIFQKNSIKFPEIIIINHLEPTIYFIQFFNNFKFYFGQLEIIEN